MRTGFTYGQKLSTEGWEFVDEILNLAIQDLNSRSRDYSVDIDLVGDETTSEDDTRLYEIVGNGWDYDSSLEVGYDEKGLFLDSYSASDGIFHQFGNSVRRVLKTSPMDWPQS